MDKALFVAMTSTAETMLAQGVVANNLANLNTTGFKATLSAERAMPTYGDGFPSRVFVGAEAPGYDYSTGSMQYTGNSLDIAVNNDGWIAVQGADGTEGYTRRGDLRIENGVLVNGANQVVVGDGGPINVAAAQRVTIAEDGAVNVVPMENDAINLFVGRIKLVNPAQTELTKREDGLFVNKTGAVAEVDPTVKVNGGMLEASNVNAVGAMIELISLARAHEMSLKVMHKAEENDQASAQLLQIS